ncbi:MAG: hypothetical protein A4S12_08290 [Proteobacteria bacterium SG_bin5]|nr:hypothetical protein [Sphingomonas sp.]OQW41567.1 MAG: hypothetical protein A4S12_08290 [Proteobacteria bacterium SG_bin5]
MRNRTPVPAADRPPLPEFTPVPRKPRHDGWTPERQKAFIAALADTGSVSRAAAMVNMAQTNCYTLRRAPGAESFRKAWDAALDFGLQRLKDIAFERAIEGYLVPVFTAGKLHGFRRKHNDALLMFCLRHYGQDARGRRTTIDYFTTRADHRGRVRAIESEPVTDHTRVDRVVQQEAAGAPIADLVEFEGVELDAEAQAAIQAALIACAARRDAAERLDPPLDASEAAAADPDAVYFPARDFGAVLEPGCEDWEPFVEGEAPWEALGRADTVDRDRPGAPLGAPRLALRAAPPNKRRCAISAPFASSIPPLAPSPSRGSPAACCGSPRSR